MNLTDTSIREVIMDHILGEFETFVVVDMEGNVVFINERYAEILSVNSKDVVGMPVTDLIPGTKMHQIIKDGVEDIGSIFKLVDGRTIVCNRLPIKEKGKMIGAVAFSTFKKMDEIRIFMDKINKLNTELLIYKKELGKLRGAKYSLDQIIGETSIMKDLKKFATRVASTKSTVLISGETGTGKELFAHAIHEESARKYNSLIRLNCAALPNDLIESELFGYDEGAFTGAKKGGKLGKFELANGGSLILDEIQQLPLSAQSKLLRVIQEREIERLGSIRPVSVDVRLICITNSDLKTLIKEGKFREDLYYRIDVVEIDVPPLRKRLDDIDLLVRHFIEKMNYDLGLNITGIKPEAINFFKSHHWPGNIRELEHAIERAANEVISGELGVQNFKFISDRIRDASTKEDINVKRSLKDVRDDAEKKVIVESLFKNNGNKKATAEELGIDRSVLYDKIRKFGISVG